MPNNFFNPEEMLETGQSFVKQASDQVAKQVSVTATNAVNQVAGPGAGNTNETQSQAAMNPQGNPQQETKDFVNDLYGVSKANGQQPLTPGAGAVNGQQPPNPQEAERLAKVKKALMEQHTTSYYRPTFERPPEQEEQVADKLEREKQEEQAKKMEALQEEQKKNEVPLAVQMGSNKAERFPGASG